MVMSAVRVFAACASLLFFQNANSANCAGNGTSGECGDVVYGVGYNPSDDSIHFWMRPPIVLNCDYGNASALDRTKGFVVKRAHRHFDRINATVVAASLSNHQVNIRFSDRSGELCEVSDVILFGG